MHQLTVFLSSTVDDLGAVRDEIADELTRFGIQVLRSETNDFPVKAGVSSHEACLEAARHSDVLVTLIGMRYGGTSTTSKEGKSITWCEYDAAVAASVYPIVLIRKDANELAKQIHDERRLLLKKKKKSGALTAAQSDTILKKKFADFKPSIYNLPAQQRFIDAVRKDHVNNWVYMDWTGTTKDAVGYIMSKLASLLVSLDKEVEAYFARSGALQRLLEWIATLEEDVISGRRTSDQAIERLLDLCEAHRAPLFGFRDEDRFNFVLYALDGNVLRPKVRRTHQAIVRKNRTWAIGDGHVGSAINAPEAFATAYLPDAAGWKVDPVQDDRDNYQSAVTVPLRDGKGNADGVFIVTSNRIEHFKDNNQPEALTAAAAGRYLDCFRDWRNNDRKRKVRPHETKPILRVEDRSRPTQSGR